MFSIIAIMFSLSGEPQEKTIVARCFSYASMHSACSPLSGEPALKSIRMTLWNYVNSGWCRCYPDSWLFSGVFRHENISHFSYWKSVYFDAGVICV